MLISLALVYVARLEFFTDRVLKGEGSNPLMLIAYYSCIIGG